MKMICRNYIIATIFFVGSVLNHCNINITPVNAEILNSSPLRSRETVRNNLKISTERDKSLSARRNGFQKSLPKRPAFCSPGNELKLRNLSLSGIQSRGGSDDIETEQEYKRAIYKTVITVISAGMFGIFLSITRGISTGYEFAAAYLVEQSLSIDNIFVFIMLFDFFRVPLELQSRVLSWGIIGAVVLRGLMICVGVAAIQRFKSVILFFAAILMVSSVNLLLEKEHDGDDHLEENAVMKITKMLFPNTSSDFDGDAFFTTVEKKKVATPLFLCLVCVELSDFVFAVDSIPAVIGISKDPTVVYASNIFAILALRSLYTVVAKAVSSLHYLKPAVALVLGFVGSKMIAEYFHFEIGTGTSLGVICSLLGTGIVASLWEKSAQYNSIEFPTTGTTWSNITVVA